MVVNAAETRFFVAVASALSTSDGGVYAGASLTSMAQIVTATYKATGVALSRDEATLYFTARAPLNALYSVPASCTAACAPTLLYTADANTQLRGLFIAPAAPTSVPSASVVPSASATPGPASASPSPSHSPLPNAFASPNSLLVLRVGDGSAPLTDAAAAVFLEEYDATTVSSSSTPISSRQLSQTEGISLSGTDWSQGTLSRAADGASVLFGAVRAAVGTAAQPAASPYMPGDRVLVRVGSGGVVQSSTTVASAIYDGLIKTACALNSNGAWVVGNATQIGIGYMVDGSTSSIFTTAATNNGDFSTCVISPAGKMYVFHSSATAFYFDSFANMPTSTLLTVPAPVLFTTGIHGKQLVLNAAETKMWVADVNSAVATNAGVYYSALPALNTLSAMVASTFRVTALALSADETKLFMTTRMPTVGLYWVSATCLSLCVPTLLRPAAANTEFRGLAFAPGAWAPSASPAPSASASPHVCPLNQGWVQPKPPAGGGVPPPPNCKPCVAGSGNTAGGGVCTCTDPTQAWSSDGNTCNCASPLSTLGVVGGPCVACAASCAAGSFVSGPCTPLTDIACSLCSACGDGEVVAQACSGSSNTVCSPCAAGTFALAGAATCTTCGAGSVPAENRGGCICTDPNAVWSRASNTCACGYGFIGSPCAANPSAVTQTPTPSSTPSLSPAGSVSPTPSFSTGASPSNTPSVSPTISTTSSTTYSTSMSPSNSRTPTSSPSFGSPPSSSSSALPSPAGASSLPASTATPTPTPSPSPSKGGAGLGGAISSGSSGEGGGLSSTSLGGILVAAVIAVAAVAYAVHARGQANKGPVGGSGPSRSGGDWGDQPAARVLVNPNPLQAAQAAAYAPRAAFAPQAAGGSSTPVPGYNEWTQCTEVTTGKTWFFCESTGVTVWALPAGHTIVKQLVQ